MTLANLATTGQLKEHKPDRGEIQRLLEAARRFLKDAEAGNISAGSRFDAAYKAIMQSALAALMANGYRPSTSQPGHHATTVQSLPKTVGIEGGRIEVLDALRRKRNLSDYTGMEIDENSVKACREEAARLIGEVTAWLRKNRPDLGA